MVHSFETDLSAMFGKVPASGFTRCDRSLPGLPTYEDWESGCGTKGARPTLAANLSGSSTMVDNLSLVLEGEARDVDVAMHNLSVKFLGELSLWMSTQYLQDRVHSGTSEKECWSFVSHCVRTVFRLLGTARAPGKRTKRGPTRPPAILWGSLQAIRKMQEMLSYGFSGYPELSHVLNIHL